MQRILCAVTVITIMIIMGLYCNGMALFTYKGKDEGEYTFTMISEVSSKQYVNAYIGLFEGKKFIVYIPKTQPLFSYGDKVKANAKYNKPQGQRNYGGFDYSLYLKSKKIYGSFKFTNAQKIGNIFENNISNMTENTKKCRQNGHENTKNTILNLFSIVKHILQNIYWKYNLFINNTQKYIKNVLLVNLKKENANLAIGILIGDITNLSSEIQENFRNASLTHMLAVSGDHFSYIILAVGFIVTKLKNKRLGQFITILVIIFFIEITGATPSVMRAGIMALFIILASIVHRKPDVFTSMCASLLIQMINNPYIIFDIGTLLSYGGVIGIVLFYKIINFKINKLLKNPVNKILIYLIKAISVTLSANTIIIPLMMYNFNTISFTFVISNILAGSIMSVIVILGFIAVVIKFKPLFFILNILLTILAKIAEICGKLPLSNIYVTTPSLISIIFSYILLLIIYTKQKNKISIIILIILIIFTNIQFPIGDRLLINFIDVGQGDSTLIRTQNETILIDSGGSTDENFDVGKNILLPYLLDRKIKTIDYIIVSHFDADHCKGFLYVMQHLNVKNAILGEQVENSKLYENFIKISKQKHTKIIYVKGGDKLNLKKLQFEFFSPLRPYIQDNPMNNNAIVCKLLYDKFSMLFTGDIEKEAEDRLLQKYGSEELHATILKVSHHGSKTSTTANFLNEVNPKVALIGVGKDNKFGHPNDEIIKRLNEKKIKIYRTDENGEISLVAYKNEKTLIFIRL